MATPAEGIESLTDQQRLALEQFTAVTAQDANEAIPLLTRCEWNVQIAIARFFDGEPAPDPEPVVPAPESVRRQETLLNTFNDVPRRPLSGLRHLEPAPRVVATPESQVNAQPPLLVALSLAPVNLLLGLFSRLYSLVSHFVPFFPTLFQRITARLGSFSSLHSSTVQRPTLSPQATADRFTREFRDTYGDHPLPLVNASYARAYDLAKAELKFLLVAPLSSEHQDTDSYVRDVLLSEHLAQYIASSSQNLLVWIGSTADAETYTAASSLNITRFPSAVLIAHTPSVSSTAMSIVARITGRVSPQSFRQKVEAAIEQFKEPLERARAAKQDQQASRSLRDEQQSAYERSLAKDRERVRLKREAEEEKTRKEQEKRTEEDRAAQHARDLQQWKTWRASRIAPEPGQDVTEVARISVRLMDGSRVVRRFNADTPLEQLYAFVECQDVLKEPVSSEKPPREPAGFTHEYGFKLVEVMPRREYDLAGGGTLKERIGRSGNLIAERVEEGDNEDSA